MKYNNIREEALKNKVSADWFADFDTTEVIGNIDFCVFPKQNTLFEPTVLLWAEAKTGDFDLIAMFVQLVLTVGKARTFDKMLPPPFLGAFDFKKIAFVPYSSIQDIFYLNDFNWNVTPSNHESKEFKLIKGRIEANLAQDTYLYDYEKDANELHIFIKNNIATANESSKIKIDKNNFVPIYLRWLETIKPTIDVNWEDLKKVNILDSDFYLADLFVDDKDTEGIADDTTIKDNLFVFFERKKYVIPRKYLNTIFDAGIQLKNENTYQHFWKRYKRPPLQAFQDYIIERRDLLVPQDIRERKGAFFTPRQWVELSQQYLTDVLGENWQEEYYIWDCAAGTGNLLAGLTNKYQIWASTLDQADVNVMHDRIDNGANLLKKHVFQFDFLNDDFTKLPQGLQDIINDPEKRKKLVVYMNPPYADASSNIKASKKEGNSFTKTHEKYKAKLGSFGREIYAQFLIRIYFEIPNCRIAEFSKLKFLTVSHAKQMRTHFLAELEKSFMVPANTFDNVTGQFPIVFKIWNTANKQNFLQCSIDIFDKNRKNIGLKTIYANDDAKKINRWLKEVKEDINGLGYLSMGRNDFQNKNLIFIINLKALATNYSYPINRENLQKVCIYFCVQNVIKATWLNDRDLFLYPNDGWQTDKEFQNDCFAFTLFSNNIQSELSTNHWIPFTEYEVDASDTFASNFMTDFIKGKIKPDEVEDLFAVKEEAAHYAIPLKFSDEAQAVFEAGRMLWRYYHAQKEVNVNAGLYDIKAHFQGRSNAGRMNGKSEDEQYNTLIAILRDKLNDLADKITPKVYEYGFLKA